MKSYRIIVLLGFLLLGQASYAQYDLFNKPQTERFIQIGGGYFFGDIGGRQKNSLLILGYEGVDFASTKPSFGFGLKHNFTQYFALRGSVNYMYLQESDAKSYSSGRHSRNLSFRTNIYEATVVTEFRIVNFNINTKSRKSSWEYYLFGGVGGFYFNPKAKYKGKNVALRPLTTEGQGLLPGTKPYADFALALPIGGGLRYGYGYSSSFYLEIGYRVTNTDYIDDVSTSYYSREELLINRGRVSAAMSYTGTDPGYPAGRDRGNRFNNDSYLTVNIGFCTPLRSRKLIRFNGR
jgi:hypothetical protein